MNDILYNDPNSESIKSVRMPLEDAMYYNEMVMNNDFSRLYSEIQANSFGRIGIAVDTSNYRSHYYSFGD